MGDGHQVYLGLGSNLGDRERTIREAIRLIGERVGEVERQSSLIETEAWGFESEHLFLNGVVVCRTALTPGEVLAATQQIERELGKSAVHKTERRSPSDSCVPLVASDQRSSGKSAGTERSTFNVQRSTFKDRPIDIDILLYDDLTVDEPDLKIPHPLMKERAFVMRPLEEVLHRIDTD